MNEDEPPTDAALQAERTPAATETVSPFYVFLVMTVIGGAMGAVGFFAADALQPKPTAGDLAAEAARYLRFRKAAPLSAPLAELLASPDLYVQPSQEHPLVGKPAPDFTLMNHRREPIALADLKAAGPVVVVFYNGYACDHCVAQLFGLHEDAARFQELGATIVAVSDDPPETTEERFGQYGPFVFPTLSDPDHAAGAAYGTYYPAADGAPPRAYHGTFVVDRKGTVVWAELGDQPFLGNKTLLYELAKSEGRLPRK
ncbi:MAG: peroxiredoxin family protein [Planctomycetia bacterium]